MLQLKLSDLEKRAPGSHGRLNRSRSYEFLPPNMAELRVVLLGNNQSERNAVGDLLLGTTVLSGHDPLNDCVRISGLFENIKMAVINTPDLLDPNISLTETVQSCVRCTAPGPHVFLLVLQPDDFTEEQRDKLQKVLETFSDCPFDHSFVLVSTPRQQSTGQMLNYMEHPPLQEMIRKCRYRHLQQKKPELLELLTRLGQVAKENNGQHAHCDSKTSPVGADASGLRIVLLGKSEGQKVKLGNLITRNEAFWYRWWFQWRYCEPNDGKWKGKSVRVVKTTDLACGSVDLLRQEMETCASLCSPGPNVILLLLKPSEFTEGDRNTLNIILRLFNQEAFNYSMVITTYEGHETNISIKRTIEDCGGRHYGMPENNRLSLMEKIESILSQNRGTYLTFGKGRDHLGRPSCRDTMTPKSNPPLNLVLCGTRGAEKTAVANTILGQTYSPGSSSSTECVKRQEVVCGRWVTLVDLPALYETSEEAVIHNAFSCISLCDEGVHAFLLVVTDGAVTYEDKGELNTIQDVFSSEINDFTMVLLTVKSDQNTSGFAKIEGNDTDIQELRQSCGGRCTVFNIKDKKQVPELLDAVEKMRSPEGKTLCFTRDMFTKAQMEKVIQLKFRRHGEFQWKGIPGDGDNQSSDHLRIVLIGKTGSGKSASGNTFLGQKIFESKPYQLSATKCCQKESGEVDGHPLVVVDTPGLFDSSRSHKDVCEELIKCFNLLAPGPHVFLLVLEIGRLTPEDKETLKLIQKAFGKNSKKFTIILFTRGDSLKKHDLSTEQFIDQGLDDSFKNLIADCGGRYHVFDNHDENNRKQVSDLLMKVENMLEVNGGGYYTTGTFQDAEAAIQKEVKKILKEKEDEMKREMEARAKTHEEEKKEMRKKMEEQQLEIQKERQIREIQLKEKEDQINKLDEERKKEQETRKEEDRIRKEEDETKQKEWEEKLVALEREKKIGYELKQEEMRKQREEWEKERDGWWDKRHQEEEERIEEERNKLKILQDEFNVEREKLEKKRREEDEYRRQEEEKVRQKMEKDHEEEKLMMMKEYESQARKKAEEFNEFKEKHHQVVKYQVEEHMTQMKQCTIL